MSDTAEPAPTLDTLPAEAASEVLRRCCGAARWVTRMLERRPFGSRAGVLLAAAEVWAELGPEDFREAFAEHPEIGANLDGLREKFAATADLSRAEQSAASGASEETLLRLRQGNQVYRARFGYSFIVCATGKSAEEMRHLLEARLGNSVEEELLVAAREQAKITQLRLEKLGP